VFRQAKIPYLVLETNPETVRRAAAAGEPICFGDATGREILEKAGAERARAVVFAISDPFALGRGVTRARAAAPRAQVIVRAKRVEEAESLERAGASEVVSEESEAAQEIILRVLKVYGIARATAFELLRREPIPEETHRWKRDSKLEVR
jgi:CPA2 family monovalent cation:H+ antiporter-2